MSTVIEPTSAPPPAPRPQSTETIADLLRRLGDIPADRVRLHPPPGTATFADLVQVNEERRGPTCEWVDGTLVEKAVGMFEWWLSMIVGGELYKFLETHDIGMICGEAAVMRILPNIGRAPDVAFLAWSSLPDGKPPARSDPVPEVVPDLAVEVLSKSNTKREMQRKRKEYFQAGVKLVWEIYPETRAANVYTAVDTVTPIPAGGTLDGGTVLPGFRLSLQAVFDRAERQGNRV